MLSFLHALSAWAIPMLVVAIPLYAAFRKVPVYETFVDGAKDGFQTAIGIIPHLVGMMTAIGMFRASGALDALVDLVRPFFERWACPGTCFRSAFSARLPERVRLRSRPI